VNLTPVKRLAWSIACIPRASAASSCFASAVRVDLLGQRFEPVVANDLELPVHDGLGT
jgi:hypothetical protein